MWQMQYAVGHSNVLSIVTNVFVLEMLLPQPTMLIVPLGVSNSTVGKENPLNGCYHQGSLFLLS